MSWYLERAERDQQDSEMAGDMASLLEDMEHRNRLDAMTADDVWEALVEGHGYPGMDDRYRGWLDTMALFIEDRVQDLPYVVPKLSRQQREYCQGLIRAMFEELMEAFR
jgi:hypothetical protein